MADSGSGISQATEEVAQTVGEVAKDVKDAAGEAIEQGIQSVVGIQLTPQQIQQKQLEDQKKLAEARGKIAFWEKTQKEQIKVRQEMKQKEEQRLQEGQAQKQQEQIKIIEKKQEAKAILTPTPISSIENKSKMAA